jgi:hypothetical protein
MNDDIMSLILGYKSDLDETQKCIDLLNERYNSIIDLKFSKYEHVLMFLEILESEISESLLIFLENPFPLCLDMEYCCDMEGHYRYTANEALTLGVLIEFVRHLKNEGMICEHEIVEGIGVSSIITCIRLKILWI